MKRLLTALALSLSASAQADVIYEWGGSCATTCTGFAHVTLSITDNYTPGTLLQVSPFAGSPNHIVSFHYHDNLRTFDLGGNHAVHPGSGGFDWMGQGTLPASFGSAFLDLNWNEYFFRTATDGSWSLRMDDPDVHNVRGSGGAYTLQVATVAVPEPSSLSLALFGLLGFCGIWMRERRRAA